MCLRLSVSVHVSQMFFVCANIVLRSSSIGTPSCVQNLEWTCVRREKPMKYHAFSLPLLEQAQKNVFLEERVQVLQQQNEDLLAQIQMNLAISRCVSGAVSASAPENRCNDPNYIYLYVVLGFFCPLQAAVGGKRQPAGVGGEGEHREEEAEHEQRGVAVAPPDQPPHVAGLLAAAPLLLHLPRSFLASLSSLLLPIQHTCGLLRLAHSLPGLQPDASSRLAVPQGWSQSQSFIQPGHTHPQGRW